MRDAERIEDPGGTGKPLPPSRALVFVDRRRRARTLVQTPADFVAQLIACAGGLEQFRRARRREAADGARHYRGQEAAVAAGFERTV